MDKNIERDSKSNAGRGSFNILLPVTVPGIPHVFGAHAGGGGRLPQTSYLIGARVGGWVGEWVGGWVWVGGGWRRDAEALRHIPRCFGRHNIATPLLGRSIFPEMSSILVPRGGARGFLSGRVGGFFKLAFASVGGGVGWRRRERPGWLSSYICLVVY